MEVGKIYKVAFDVGWTSQVFNRGHRIRITVASTGAPFYEPNPNTGESLTVEPPKATVVATNAVHHDRKNASRILAPVKTSGMTLEERGQIERGLADLSSRLVKLRGKAHTADAEVFAKGLTWALRYDTQLTPADVALL